MSATSARPRRPRLGGRLAPRPSPLSGDPAGRDVRGIETAVVLLIGVILLIAVIHDVARQTSINIRVSADKSTWRLYAHRRDKKLDVRLLAHGTTDYLCQSTPLARSARAPRLCLMIDGPTRRGLRTVEGGYHIPPLRQDRYITRTGCFGLPATLHLCGGKAPPA